MFVIPEEKGESKEREVVVCTLEAGEAGKHDHGYEQFFDVLYHFQTND